MKTKLLMTLLLISQLLFISSCSSQKGQSGKGNITESAWGLVSVKAATSDSLLMPLKEEVPTLNVLTDGTIKGTTGCNSFEGQVAVTGYNLKFGNLLFTHVSCPDRAIENAFYASLDSTDNYTVDHGHLLLKKGDKVLAKFMPLDMR
ncbi:MAG: META domain-containing protein [Bacteroidota bacterium]|nr:META domain-containing protein [Bacteroidota bacterium]